MPGLSQNLRQQALEKIATLSTTPGAQEHGKADFLRLCKALPERTATLKAGAKVNGYANQGSLSHAPMVRRPRMA